MKTFAVIAAVLAVPAIAVAAAATQGLAIGEKAPAFDAPATLNGKEFAFKLGDQLKKGPVVLYFYPKAFTAGCSAEAKAFAAASDEFKAMNATVIGASADDMETLHKFSTTDCGGKFAVASATKAQINAWKAGMGAMNMSTRISYVITPDGKVALSHLDMNPMSHIEESKKAVAAWKAKNPRG